MAKEWVRIKEGPPCKICGRKTELVRTVDGDVYYQHVGEGQNETGSGGEENKMKVLIKCPKCGHEFVEEVEYEYEEEETT